jgi:HAE1 family hydrophobic/amphiphilic exporter-1
LWSYLPFLSFIGALLALALTNNTLNIFTILGVIMLIGLVCKNAIMLVDYTNQRRAAGETIRTALIQTTLVCAYFDDNNRHGIWNVPYCISGWSRCRMEKRIGMGNHWWFDKFLFLTLIIVPVIYEIMEN